MKASELMLNDWVFIFDPDFKDDKEAYQVSEIKEEGIRTRMFTDLYEEGWFEPIPLTEEVLKKNGFEDETADFWKLRVDDKPHHYSFRLNKGGVFGGKGYNMNCNIYTITISYIHELQRVLRCCGLTELANNFKI